MNFQKMNFQKILLFLVMSATALATATAVIAMSAILPRSDKEEDDETSQNEGNSSTPLAVMCARPRI